MYIQSTGKGLDILLNSDDKKPYAATNSPPNQKYQQSQLNTAILQANANVSLKSGNESLSLLYKTVLEGINEALKDELGDDAIQANYEAGTDVSPEATAERIVSQSTGFLSSFQQNNPTLSTDEALTKFAEIIQGGIDKGFSEAREILVSLAVLEGTIADDIDTTYNLVQTGLSMFFENYTPPTTDI